jgi:hypothetical protein
MPLFFGVRMMLNHQGVDHKDHILSDVRGMVCNPLKAPAHDHEVNGPCVLIG